MSVSQGTNLMCLLFSAGKCPFSSGKAVVDALKSIHPTPAMKVGNVFPQPSGVRQMVTMPLGVQGIKFCLWVFITLFLGLFFECLLNITRASVLTITILEGKVPV